MATKQFAVRIDESVLEAFRKKCEIEDLSQVSVIETLVRYYNDGKIIIKKPTGYEIEFKD